MEFHLGDEKGEAANITNVLRLVIYIQEVVCRDGLATENFMKRKPTSRRSVYQYLHRMPRERISYTSMCVRFLFS
ncbi:hypothetical protein BC936DRAFT_148837 [Jimgerdemannia flammicorona]|uniref:Uncharacterized protein n=1 Tax=Jimgerdemannia flammicorona TaxID=994334 RepID=A0A433DKI0_9FUNG|nr:hypothetical protein BC936DRAFT_148837 [Jimgerdemannia flammicorona]